MKKLVILCTVFLVVLLSIVLVAGCEEESELTPATFSVSNLSIEPQQVQPNEVVTIAMSVANTGGSAGSYTVTLKINGVQEADETITIAAGDSQRVSFSVTQEEVGSYNVVVDGLTGSFTVATVPSPPPEETKTYTNSEHGISFNYPTNWRQVGLTGYTDAIWKIAFEEPVSGIAPGVGVIKYDMKGETLEDFHDRMASELVVFGSRNVLTVVEVKINGVDAYITTFTEESSQGTIKGKEMTITKDHKIAYCIDCYSLLSDYDRSKENFDMIHNSFRIE